MTLDETKALRSGDPVMARVVDSGDRRESWAACRIVHVYPDTSIRLVGLPGMMPIYVLPHKLRHPTAQELLELDWPQ